MVCLVKRFRWLCYATNVAVAGIFVFISAASAMPLGYRSIDGGGNNTVVGQEHWGSAGTQLLRGEYVGGRATSNYGDGVSTPSGFHESYGQKQPSAREVSNAVSAQTRSIPSSKGVSDMLWQWGQFLDHDIDLTPSNSAEPLPIATPSDDPRFSQDIGFNRSVYDHATGTSTSNPRQQVNEITAFIDASNVYGSDAATAAALRTGVGGRMLTTPSPNGDLLPVVSTHQGPMFMAGDVRANEQSGLTAMHTLFVREHNRLASQIALTNPTWDDEEIYQEARKIVGAMTQSITFNEFLPALLGSGAPGNYGGYDDSVNPGIANEFSTAAYRFGHSMLSPTLLRLDENGDEIANGHLPLANAFFNPSHILDPANGGIEPLLRGLASQRAQEIDPFVVDAVRNLLFATPAEIGFDLAALNMQRGRDHGLLGYNELRAIVLGVDKFTGWDDPAINFLPGAKEALMTVYTGIDDVDLWIGGLAEVHVDDGLLGELFAAILLDQFERLRAGDAFWYQNAMFEQEWMDFIESSTLSTIIMRNTRIDHMQANVFSVPEPGMLAIFSFGLAGLGYAQRKKTA